MTSRKSTDDAGDDDKCVTCSDEASVGVLMSHPNAAATLSPLSMWGSLLMESGETETASLWLVPGAMVGDRLLVHAGVAIADLGPVPDGPEEPDQAA